LTLYRNSIGPSFPDTKQQIILDITNPLSMKHKNDTFMFPAHILKKLDVKDNMKWGLKHIFTIFLLITTINIFM